MNDKLVKVKRRRVDWNQLRLDLADPDIDADFYKLLQKHTIRSMNRISYNVLKKHYSTTALLRYRFTGEL